MGKCVYPHIVCNVKRMELNENIILRLRCMKHNRDLSRRNGR
jgi:hypothetical protein